MAYADYFRINITITDIHRLNSSIWDFSNDFQNKHLPINKRFYVSPPPYYLEWFEKYHLNFHINFDDVPFFLQCIIVIKENNQPDDNGIVSLAQWLQSPNIQKAQFIMP